MESEESKPGIKQFFTRSRVFYIVLCLIVLLLAGYGGRYLYNYYRYPEHSVIKGVPGSSIMVVEGEGILGFLDDLLKGSLWRQGFEASDEIDHLSFIQKELFDIASSGSSDLASLIKKQPFCISLVPKKVDGPAFLFLLQLKRGMRPGDIHVMLKQHWPSYAEKQLLEISYHERVLPDGSPLFVAIRNGIMMASVDREVFELAYYTLESGNNITRDASFAEVRENISKSQNPSPRVYLSYEGFYKWVSRYIDESNKPMIASLPDMGSWAALELTFRNAGAHLQGFSKSPKTGVAYQSALQKAIDILEDPGLVLPANTIYYDQMALNSWSDFHKNFIEGFALRRDGVKRSYPVDERSVDSLKKVFANADIRSVTLAITDAFDSVAGSNYLLLFEAEDIHSLSESLTLLSDTMKRLNYQSFEVLSLQSSYILPALFGSRYHHFEESFFTIYRNWLIVAPSNQTLLTVLNNLTLGRTLLAEAGYSEGMKDVQGRISRRYYLDRSKGTRFMRSLADAGRLDAFDRLMPFLPQQFVLSYTREDDVILTDIVMIVAGDIRSSGDGSEVLLDDVPAVKPLIIRDHRNGENKVMVADESGFLYLLNSSGGIEWKMEIKEVPLSEMQYIDLYKNGRNQCVFLSRNMIHLIQIDGRYVTGYPAKLNQQFHTGLSVFDYDSNGNYRLTYLNMSGKLSNIDIAGNAVAGWTYPSARMLKRPLIHLKNGGMDFLILQDSLGTLHFLDRRGNERFKLHDTIQAGNNTDILLTRSLGEVHFTFLDKNGMLLQVSVDGTVRVNEAVKFLPDSYFLKASTTPAGAGNTFLVAEPYQLSLFDQDLKLLDRNSELESRWSSFEITDRDPEIIATAIDGSFQPMIITRKGLKVLEVSGRSYDHFRVWRQKNEKPLSTLFVKGKVVILKNL